MSLAMIGAPWPVELAHMGPSTDFSAVVLVVAGGALVGGLVLGTATFLLRRPLGLTTVSWARCGVHATTGVGVVVLALATLGGGKSTGLVMAGPIELVAAFLLARFVYFPGLSLRAASIVALLHAAVLAGVLFLLLR